jgi:hypothetical protein
MKLHLVSCSKEFEDVKLRINEKSMLNTLNNNGKIPKKSANAESSANVIRYQMSGKIKTVPMKINA